MQCPSCGHSVPEEEPKFCSSCGSPLAPASSRESSDAIAAVDRAVDAFEEGELQRALDLLDEELDRAEEEKDEVSLIYLLDVSRQMVAQLDEGEFEDLEQLVADAEEALHAAQEGILPATLEAARDQFAQGDQPRALELLYQELAEIQIADEESTRLAAWRVFAVAGDMADALGGSDARPFKQVRVSAERRLEIASESEVGRLDDQPSISASNKRTLVLDEGEVSDQELEGVEDETALEPFETPNPWLQKLFGMPAYGTVPAMAARLLREVSPDRDERLLAAIKVQHGRVRRGYLLATTKWLRWIGTFPTRQDDMWSYEYKLECHGISLTKAVIRSVSGDQFQTWRTRAKPFAQMYSVIQQAMVWAADNAEQMAISADSTTTSSSSLADEIRQLSEMLQKGLLTPEEFAAAKLKLIS